MSKDAKVTGEALRESVNSEFEALLDAVSGAVNDAPDGAVIAGSEEQVRDATAEFRQLLYERAVQLRTDAAKAAFSPSGERKGPGLEEQGSSVGASPDGQRVDSD